MSEKATKPKAAPVSIMPSMAMLMTPERSHHRPAIEPMTIGVARRRLEASMLTALVLRPAAARMRMVGKSSSAASSIARKWKRFSRPPGSRPGMPAMTYQAPTTNSQG